MIDHPTAERYREILYCNDGDWVESCTTLVEDYAGRLQIIAWTEAQPARSRAPLAKAMA